MDNMTPVLEVKNISKDFFGNQVLKDINFSMEKGEILGCWHTHCEESA